MCMFVLNVWILTPPLTHLAPRSLVGDERSRDLAWKRRGKKRRGRRQAQLAEKEASEGAHLLQPRPDQKQQGGEGWEWGGLSASLALSTLVAAAGDASTWPWAEQERRRRWRCWWRCAAN